MSHEKVNIHLIIFWKMDKDKIRTIGNKFRSGGTITFQQPFLYLEDKELYTIGEDCYGFCAHMDIMMLTLFIPNKQLC